MMRITIKKITSYKKDVAGILLFLAGIIIFMGIITGEIYYPNNYSTRDNEISDLGATRPPDSKITQPSATIFNSTMILSGIMVILASYFIHLEKQICYVSMPVTFLGIGLLGVGIFPGNITPFHSIFALITFLSGGIGAIISTKITRFPINIIFICLGIISLFFLFFNQLFIPYLGDGGTERWLAYPILFWMTGLGAYLLGNITMKAKKTLSNTKTEQW